MLNLDSAVKLLGKLNIRHRESGEAIPFKLNRNQLITVEKLKEQALSGKPLRWICLKARRVGMSSLTDGLMFTYALNNPGRDIRIVSHQEDSVEKLFSVPLSLYKDAMRKMPYLGLAKPFTEKLIIPHETGDTIMDISTAGSTQGGRGGGFFFLHLSEVGFFKSPEAFLSLVNTVPHHPNTAICIESTANGRVGMGEAFYKRWNAAVRGESEYLPIFLSWTDDPACVRDARNLDVATFDEEEKDLVKYFNLTPEQLAWRRWAIVDLCDGYVEKFHQEYPVTPEEAFIASSDPAFTGEEMRAARASIAKPTIGQLEVKSGAVVFTEGRGILKLWEKPKAGDYYFIGVDSARGQDTGDFASITVLNGTTNSTAARYDAKISPRALAKVVYDLAKWFNNALVIFELTGNLGLEAQNELRDVLGYRKFYRRRGKDDKLNQTKPSNIAGWETNHRTRDQLINSFRESVREGGLLVKDESVVGQMDLAQRFAMGSFEVKRGHDDALFSIMLANIACRQYPPPKIAGFKSPESDKKEEPMPRAKTVGDTIATTQMQMGNAHIRKILNYHKDAKAEALAKSRLEGL